MKSMIRYKKAPEESGSALLLALLVLSILSLLGLVVSLNATAGVQISDNFESELQATYAALGGLNHAKNLFRGLSLDDLLVGADGTYDPSAEYRAEAKLYLFRMPLSLSIALNLNIVDPSSDVLGINDDGLISTGICDGIPGVELIPKTGISQFAQDPSGLGMIVSSRYFVKVTDNNGDASETAEDPTDNPFHDGDGIVIVRSMGVSRAVSEKVGAASRRNAVSVFEGRFKRPSTWNIGSALIIIGSRVAADFEGAFEISGGDYPGIGTIDPFPNDVEFPDQTLRAAAAGKGDISGGGIPHPSILDLAAQIHADSDRVRLLQPEYLWKFIHEEAPRIADSYHEGNQSWAALSAPDLGTYDLARSYNAPGQDPRITVVNGDLEAGGGLSGGGLLIVTGSFLCSGPITYNGLILVIGSGSLHIDGNGSVIEGGVFVASLSGGGGIIRFGVPRISIIGDNRLHSNQDAVRMATGLIPPAQISFREIVGSDP